MCGSWKWFEGEGYITMTDISYNEIFYLDMDYNEEHIRGRPLF